MAQAATYFSLLHLATLHLGRSWVEDGVDEQFYSLSATDAKGQNIAMSSYVGKVMWNCVNTETCEVTTIKKQPTKYKMCDTYKIYKNVICVTVNASFSSSVHSRHSNLI